MLSQVRAAHILLARCLNGSVCCYVLRRRAHTARIPASLHARSDSNFSLIHRLPAGNVSGPWDGKIILEGSNPGFIPMFESNVFDASHRLVGRVVDVMGYALMC